MYSGQDVSDELYIQNTLEKGKTEMQKPKHKSKRHNRRESQQFVQFFCQGEQMVPLQKMFSVFGTKPYYW